MKKIINMYTLAIMTLVINYYLIFRLNFITYPSSGILAGAFNFRRSFFALRDFFGLMTIPMLVAMLLTQSITIDIYDLPLDGSFRSRVIGLGEEVRVKLLFLFSFLTFIFILVYDYLILRKQRAKYNPKYAVTNSKYSESDIEQAKKEKGGNILRLKLIPLLIFIILSIGEGFFQDLFYEPYIKPFLCKSFNLLC